MRIIVLLLLSNICIAQMYKKSPDIKVTSPLYLTANIKKSNILTYQPNRLPVKFTMKAGYVKNISSQKLDFTEIGRVDTRLKIYLNKRAGLVFGAVLQKPNFYTVGLRLKI